MGIFVGIKIEERLALGIQVMRIITNHDYEELVAALRNSNFGTTVIDGHGSKGPVKIILTVFKRKDFPIVQGLIKEHHASAFYSVEDIRNASHGVFPQQSSSRLDTLKRVFPYSAGR